MRYVGTHKRRHKRKEVRRHKKETLEESCEEVWFWKKMRRKQRTHMEEDTVRETAGDTLLK